MVMGRIGHGPKRLFAEMTATWRFGAVFLLYKGHMIQMLVISSTSDYIGKYIGATICESKKEGKDQQSIQLSARLDQDTIGKVTISHLDIR